MSRREPRREGLCFAYLHLYYRLCADIIRTPTLREQLGGNLDELRHLVSVIEQCVRNLLIHDRYSPPEAAPPKRGLEALFSDMQSADAGMDRVMSAYSTWVYAKKGSFEKAAQALGVDRRTVSKHVDRELLDDFE